jgi:hypothetical protein
MPGNSPGGLKGFTQDVGEAAVAPVRDEFAKALEEGQSQVLGKAPQSQTQNQNQNQPQPKTPEEAEEQQKIRQHEEVQKRNIQSFFQGLIQQEQKTKQQKTQEQQKKQQDIQVEQEKKQVKQFEVQKKQKVMTDLQSKQRNVEIKKGGF